jgi:CheY-like chemotaxis protein
MTAAKTVREEFLPNLQLPGVDLPGFHNSLQQDKPLHLIPVVILTSSANGNAITRSFEYPAASCIVKHVTVTGFHKMMDDFGLCLPGKNGNLPRYLA